jgi:hypothetical protein
MNDLRFEKRLGALLPAAPPPSLARALERELKAKAPLDPASPDFQIPVLEQALRGVSPVAASLEMRDAVAHELAGDEVLEQALRRLVPASVSNQTGHAISAQMELRVLAAHQPSNIPPAQTTAPGASPSPRLSPRRMWIALAAAVAVSCVGFWLLRREMPLQSGEENGASPRENLAEGGFNHARPAGPGWDGDPHAASAPGRAMRGAQGGAGVDARSTSSTGARRTDAFGSAEFSAEKGRRETTARLNGGSVLDPEPENVDDSDAPSGRPLEARKLAQIARTPGGLQGVTGAISSRSILGSGTGVVTAAATQVGADAPYMEPNLLETLASGRVSEVLPVEVIGLIREASTPRDTLALSRQESAGAGASALQIAIASPTAPPRGGGTEGSARGSSGSEAGSATPVASVSETSPGALTVSGLTTTASAGAPFLGGERSVVLNASGRVGDASVPLAFPERSPGGVPGISADAEQIVHESTDGAVTFRMVRSGYGTLGRVSDAAGRVITEGLVMSSEDVARIAQRAILIQQLEGTTPASKGD